MDTHRHPFRGALDLDERNAAVLKTLLEIVPDEHVFIQIIGHLLLGKPVRMPGTGDSQP